MPRERPLIHVGYHKTGTTWLQRRVFAEGAYGFKHVHPRTIVDEAFIITNPLEFDPNHARRLIEPSFDAAVAIGAHPVISHERLSGSPLSGAFDAKAIADRLHATYPQGRILIVFREQKAMMLSIYKHHVLRSGYEKIGTIWRERTIRERRSAVPDLYVFEYHHLIRYYQGLFGADRVLALPFEFLMADPTGFVRAIAEHTGVTPPQDVPLEKENVALPALSLAVLRRFNFVMGKVAPKVMSGPIADSTTRQRTHRALQRFGRYAPAGLSKRIERTWRSQIAELASGRFAQSNRITQELTGLELATYGYELET
jgi:hypothetical protein